MRKLTPIFILLLLTTALFACGGGSGSHDSDSDNESSFDYNADGFPRVKGDYEIIIEPSDFICNDEIILADDSFLANITIDQTLDKLKKSSGYETSESTSWITTGLFWYGSIDENAVFTINLGYAVGDGPLNNGCSFCEIHRTDATLTGRFTPTGWSGTYEFWRITRPSREFNDLEVDEICTFSSTFTGSKL